MKVFKGTDKNMKCRGYQYELGKTETTDHAELCEAGFHACERPLDVFGYYPPGESRYFEADLEDVSDERGDDDTKVVGKKITLRAELSIAKLCKAQIEYVKEHTTTEYTDPERATAGEYGAATAGEYGAATAGYAGAATAGNRGAATAGYAGAATARGKVSVGENGCGLVRGNDVKIRGGLGAVLVICEEEKTSYNIANWRAFIVDGETIKADTWYRINGDELEEVKE